MKLKLQTISLYSSHAEHIGLVAYAACEACRAELLLHYCVIWLVITGVYVVITRDIHPRRSAD